MPADEHCALVCTVVGEETQSSATAVLRVPSQHRKREEVSRPSQGDGRYSAEQVRQTGETVQNQHDKIKTLLSTALQKEELY